MDDHRLIEHALARFIYGVDRQDWELFASSLTEDFRYGYKDPTGRRWVWMSGRDEMVKRIRPVAESALAAQHFCPNPYIEVNGDRATLLVNHMAYLFLPGVGGDGESCGPQRNEVAGRWEAELRRTEEAEWRFSGIVFEPTFLDPWRDDLLSFPPRGPAAQTPWEVTP